MRWEPTEEQQLVQRTARELAVREIEPVARELDRTGRWPAEIVRRLGELGLMGIAVPTEWGGAGADHVAYVLAMEEISRACASVGVILSVNNSLVCAPLLEHGSELLKRRYLEPLASGRMLGCFALTEPASGSDAAHMQTVAERDGEGWILNGSKNWITNGPHADVCIVFAATDRAAGARGVTAFVVERGTPGYAPQKPDEKLGIHAAHSCTVFFENCRVPDAQRLGEVGQGFKIAMKTLDGGRIGIAAQAIGIARAAFEKALAYSRERRAFGTPLADKQAIQFKLADMATEIDAAHLLALRAAWMKDRGVRHTAESSIAKLFASEMATRVTHQAMQIFGGYGYSREYDLERHYRDARITEIYEGTSEIQRIVIAAQVLRD
ncbi:MAG: acyl-CoA dehydrogenase [Myxococcota bacterium]|nr:acyl-CoA dehydrogenase [Myxococcota bacterium]MDW8362444.1 acyl-CoA dehydrogenase [Myxococcales bacterium]